MIGMRATLRQRRSAIASRFQNWTKCHDKRPAGIRSDADSEWSENMRKQGILTIFCAVSALIILTVVEAPNTAAHETDNWSVKKKLDGEPIEKKDKFKKAEDVSGIDCDRREGFPRLCMIIDDEARHAQFVEMEDGKLTARKRVPLFQDVEEGEQHEFDGEGVAYSDGSFYIIGSHGYPRDRKRKLDAVRHAEDIAKRIAATSHVIRIDVPKKKNLPVVTRSSGLKKVIRAQPELNRFFERRLENNGLTIEGVAIRSDQIYVGFRAPHLDDGRAVVLSTRLSSLFNNGDDDTEIHLLRLGNGQGIRDLTRYNDGFLVLSGPTDDSPGSYSVYWWSGEGTHVRFLKSLAGIVGDDPMRRPEAIVALDDSLYGLRALILFDGKEEGMPTPVEMPAP